MYFAAGRVDCHITTAAKQRRKIDGVIFEDYCAYVSKALIVTNAKRRGAAAISFSYDTETTYWWRREIWRDREYDMREIERRIS